MTSHIRRAQSSEWLVGILVSSTLRTKSGFVRKGIFVWASWASRVKVGGGGIWQRSGKAGRRPRNEAPRHLCVLFTWFNGSTICAAQIVEPSKLLRLTYECEEAIIPACAKRRFLPVCVGTSKGMWFYAHPTLGLSTTGWNTSLARGLSFHPLKEPRSWHRHKRLVLHVGNPKPVSLGGKDEDVGSLRYVGIIRWGRRSG